MPLYFHIHCCLHITYKRFIYQMPFALTWVLSILNIWLVVKRWNEYLTRPVRQLTASHSSHRRLPVPRQLGAPLPTLTLLALTGVQQPGDVAAALHAALHPRLQLLHLGTSLSHSCCVDLTCLVLCCVVWVSGGVVE